MSNISPLDLQCLQKILHAIIVLYKKKVRQLFSDKKEYIEMGFRPYLNRAIEIRGIESDGSLFREILDTYKDMIENK